MLSLAAARSQKPLKEPPEHPGMDEQCPETGARPLAPSLSSSTLKEPVGHNCSLKLEAHTSQTNAERHSLAFNIDRSVLAHSQRHASDGEKSMNAFTLAANQVLLTGLCIF